MSLVTRESLGAQTVKELVAGYPELDGMRLTKSKLIDYVMSELVDDKPEVDLIETDQTEEGIVYSIGDTHQGVMSDQEVTDALNRENPEPEQQIIEIKEGSNPWRLITAVRDLSAGRVSLFHAMDIGAGRLLFRMTEQRGYSQVSTSMVVGSGVLRKDVKDDDLYVITNS